MKRLLLYTGIKFLLLQIIVLIRLASTIRGFRIINKDFFFCHRISTCCLLLYCLSFRTFMILFRLKELGCKYLPNLLILFYYV